MCHLYLSDFKTQRRIIDYLPKQLISWHHHIQYMQKDLRLFGSKQFCWLLFFWEVHFEELFVLVVLVYLVLFLLCVFVQFLKVYLWSFAEKKNKLCYICREQPSERLY